MLLGFRKLLYSCTEGMCHSSTRPGTSLHVISFTRPSPALVLQMTNAGVSRPGYEASCDQVAQISPVEGRLLTNSRPSHFDNSPSLHICLHKRFGE